MQLVSRSGHFHRSSTFLALAIALTLGSTPTEAQPKPIIPLNTTTQGIQDDPAVATQSTGEIFFIWEHAARRYGADGTPMEAADFDTGVGGQPDVAMNDQGDAVVVGASSDGILARLYAFDDSVPPSDLINVHSSDEGFQTHPSVAMDATGSFIVAYAITFTNPAEDVIFVRRFGPTGIPLDDPQQVSSLNRVSLPEVAIHPNGSFVVGWRGSASNLLFPRMRFYSSSGEPTTDPFFLTDQSAGNPSLAYSPTGSLLAAFGNASGFSGVLFDPSGTMAGDPFVLVEELPGTSVVGIDAVSLASEEFQLTWFQQLNSNPGDPDVYTRRIDANGTLQDQPTLVHVDTAGQQKWPDISAVGNDVVIVFNHPDGDQSGVAAACFLPDGCVNVFQDGFESGDTAAWSGSLP